MLHMSIRRPLMKKDHDQIALNEWKVPLKKMVLKRDNTKLAFLWNMSLLSLNFHSVTLPRTSVGTLQTACEQWNCIVCSPWADASGGLSLKSLILSRKGLVKSSDSYLFLSVLQNLGISVLSVSFLSLSFLNIITFWIKTQLKKRKDVLKIWWIPAFHWILWFCDSMQFGNTVNRMTSSFISSQVCAAKVPIEFFLQN